MTQQRFLCCFLFLTIALFGRSSVAQGQPLELTMTFDFVPNVRTSGAPLAVRIGFEGGSIGVPVGSTIVSNVDVVGNRLFLSISQEPPPPSEVILPAFFLLNPVVELGVLPPGEYQIQADVLGYSGESSFVVVPEPATITLSALAGLWFVIVSGGRRRAKRLGVN